MRLVAEFEKVSLQPQNTYPHQIFSTGQSASLYLGDDASVSAGLSHATPRFLDNNDGTISDRSTGLMWLKNWADFSSSFKTWTQSLSEANSFVSAGYDDWRMPNVRELFSLIDHGTPEGQIRFSVGHPFLNVQSSNFGLYWTSTPEDAQNICVLYLTKGRIQNKALATDTAYYTVLRG